MSNLERNLKVLHERFPAVAKLIETCSTSEFALEELSPGEYDLRSTVGELRYGGKLNKLSKEAVKDAQQFIYPKIVFCYGVGLGLHIKEYFQTEMSKNAEHVILLEKSPELFRHALTINDWSELLADPRVTPMVGLANETIYESFLRYFGVSGSLIYVRAIAALHDPAIHMHNREYYLNVARQVNEAVMFANRFVFFDPEDAYRGFMNIMNNLRESVNVPSLERLEGMFKGRPGIAVSTGPSLQKSLSWLGEVQNRAVIACTDSALPILLNHGIKPHFACCLERVPETTLLFENLPEGLETWLVTTPVIWPETYAMYPGPKIHMMRTIGQLQWFYPDVKNWDTGNSSSHVAFKVVEALGCSPIMLVGQDLAFDRHSERSHVEGIPQLLYDVGQKQRRESETKSAGGDSQVLVEGNDGTPILTMSWYNDFRTYLQIMIAESESPCYNVIPADYGARIEHAIHILPDQALTLFGSEDYQIVEEVKNRLAIHPQISNDAALQIFQERVALALNYLREIEMLSLQMMDMVSIFRQRYNPAYYDEEHFQPLMRRLELIIGECYTDPDDFFNNFLLALVQNTAFALCQTSHELLTKRKTPPERIEHQLGLVMHWFRVAHQWSSRMANYIEHFGSLHDTKHDMAAEKSGDVGSAVA